MPVTDQRFLCRHIHIAGHRCGSPALRGEQFCYFHHTTRRPPQGDSIYPKGPIFVLPPLEDRTVVALAVGDILNRIADTSLDLKRAALLLYGLQVAAAALPREAVLAPTPRPAPRPKANDACVNCGYTAAEPSQPPASLPPAPSSRVEDVILDPDHGPIALAAELTPATGQVDSDRLAHPSASVDSADSADFVDHPRPIGPFGPFANLPPKAPPTLEEYLLSYRAAHPRQTPAPDTAVTPSIHQDLTNGYPTPEVSPHEWDHASASLP